jgi:hypothetical protein
MRHTLTVSKEGRRPGATIVLDFHGGKYPDPPKSVSQTLTCVLLSTIAVTAVTA